MDATNIRLRTVDVTNTELRSVNVTNILSGTSVGNTGYRQIGCKVVIMNHRSGDTAKNPGSIVG
jgi:hypothetical protein